MPMCPTPGCREPWDLDSIHEQVDEENPDQPWKKNGKHDQALYEKRYFNPMMAKFRREGCKALGSRCNVTVITDEDKFASAAQEALFDMLGDDVDGIEIEMQDLGFL